MKRLCATFILLVGFAGCSGVPSGVTVVEGFELERYLGTWYEIARLDHSFERGLSQVTARYTLRQDGRIDVLNRGYHDEQGQWRSAQAIARPAGDPTVGSLKVSFFRPFWADYHIIVLDKEAYQYAMVASSSRNYLWILARDPQIDETLLDSLLAKAQAWGYATEELIFPQHK